jgi:hypothetical protein
VHVVFVDEFTEVQQAGLVDGRGEALGRGIEDSIDVQEAKTDIRRGQGVDDISGEHGAGVSRD